MSADPVIIVERFAAHLRGLGLTVFLAPVSNDPPNVGVRLYYAGVGVQGSDRERISLEGELRGSGIDPGKYLGKIMAHSRSMAGLLSKGFEFPLSASLKAKAEVRATVEGRFAREEMEDRFDWSFQAYYRIELSYNPAVLDHPELSV